MRMVQVLLILLSVLSLSCADKQERSPRETGAQEGEEKRLCHLVYRGSPASESASDVLNGQWEIEAKEFKPVQHEGDRVFLQRGFGFSKNTRRLTKLNYYYPRQTRHSAKSIYPMSRFGYQSMTTLGPASTDQFKGYYLAVLKGPTGEGCYYTLFKPMPKNERGRRSIHAVHFDMTPKQPIFHVELKTVLETMGPKLERYFAHE